MRLYYVPKGRGVVPCTLRQMVKPTSRIRGSGKGIYCNERAKDSTRSGIESSRGGSIESINVSKEPSSGIDMSGLREALMQTTSRGVRRKVRI
jgi:hypothetical protein